MKKLSDLRTMNINELQTELMTIRKEQFNARLKKAVGNLEKTHVFKRMKKTVAQIKTLITEKAGISDDK